MSSSSLLRNGLIALMLLLPAALAGCSGLHPVYGGGGVVEDRLALAYSKPQSRLEQIIIQDLILRLGSSSDPDAPLVTITAVEGSRGLTRTGTTKPSQQKELTVSATFSIVADGKIVAEGSRRAIASYATSGQVLADEAASKDAAERASHEVAETIRLSILAALAKPLREAEASIEE